MSVERIYIGGLDPPRLKPSDVTKRIETLPGLTIVSVDANDNKPYFHVNAKANNDNESIDAKNIDPNNKALSILTKSYNNVKWKGCKLSVESARPHLLERLQQEREERSKIKEQQNQQHQQQEQLSAMKETTVDTKTAGETIPRRLRIRQRFGAAAYQVDTKPCETTNWKSFEKVLRQMNKRRDRPSSTSGGKKKKVKDQKTLAFYSRAVHLKFGEEETPGEPINYDEEDSSAALKEEDMNASDTSDSVSSKESKTNKKPEGYDWSTDESEDEELSIVDPCNPVERTEDQPERTTKHEDHTNTIDAESTESSLMEEGIENDEDHHDEGEDRDENGEDRDEEDEDHDEEGVAGLKLEPEKKQLKTKENNNTYEWSSEESDSTDSEDEGPKKSHPVENHPISEFASAIDFDDDDDDEEDGSNEIVDFETAQTSTEDLHQDVETNLGILSELFPELKVIAPKEVTNTSQEEIKKMSAWDTGMMQRYDPTKESAKKFELEEVKTEEAAPEEDEDSKDNDEMTNGSENDDDKISQSEEDAAVTEPGEMVTKGNIYHEAKLEEVFRKARDVGEGGGFQVSSKFGDQPDELKEKEKGKKPEEASGAFSFNFVVDPVTAAPKTDAKKQKGFSFGFDVKAPETSTTKDQETQEENVFMSQEPVSPATVKKRRRGMLPPDDVVSRYYNMFFELNNGLAIQEDPEGFRNDEEVRSEWKSERQQLTQDWKRKRKYAQSRLQKKNKFR